MVTGALDLRDTDAAAAALLPSIRAGRRLERDRLVFCGERALDADRLVGVLHDHRVLLDDDVVDIAATVLENN